MPNALPPTKDNSTKQAILRISNAVEDAPYALDSVAMLDARAAASCRSDDFNVRRLKAVALCTVKEPRT